MATELQRRGMSDLSKLSRRERQIMKIVFEKESATVNDIRCLMPNAPTPMAIRRLLAILVEKGFLKSKKKGREKLYFAKQKKASAGSKALKEVVDTFFNGSISQALATHLSHPRRKLSRSDVEDLSALIEELADKGESMEQEKDQ